MTFVVTGCRTKETTGGVYVYSVPQSTFENLYYDVRGAIPRPAPYYRLSAFFFDTHQGGIPRALVEGFGDSDRSGGSWELYSFRNGQWQRPPLKLVDGTFVDSSCKDVQYDEIAKWTDDVWAYPWDFYTFTEYGQPPRLLTIYIGGLADWDYGNAYIRNADNITIDSEGYLKVIPMRNFRKKFTVVYEDGTARIILKSPKDKLERVQVQTFNSKEQASGSSESTKESENPVLTRAEIIEIEAASPDWPDKDRNRLYAEIDLNEDGLMDIIISDELSMKGTGGISWFIYFCIGANQYREASKDIGGWPLAVESYGFEGTRLWSYWHMNASSGYIGYLHIGKHGECTQSPGLEISTGDGGSEIGNGIYDAVFKEDTLLPVRLISPASPESDLPYLDTPYDWW